MDIMELGAIGELLGGLAVIGSLVYVGLQVRHGSHYARIDAHREVHASLSNFMGDIGQDPELHDFYYRGIRSTEQLSLEEADRLGMLMYKMFGFLSTAHRYADLDSALWSAHQKILDRALERPWVRGWWSRQRDFHAEPFRSHVDARLDLIRARLATSGTEGV